jgi:hypothetical protein
MQALLPWRMVVSGGQGGGMSSRRCPAVSVVPHSAFKGFRFPPEIIALAVRWYLRYGLSYRERTRPCSQSALVALVSETTKVGGVGIPRLW